MESSFRADYLNSEQAVKDQQAREKQMAEFADKSSLIEFMSELRTKTHCDNIQPGGQMAARVSDDDKDSVSTDTAANNVNIQNDRIVDEDHNGNINYSDSESVVAGNAEADDKIQPQVNLPSSIRLLKGKRGWYAVAAAVILIVVGGLIWYFVGSYHDDSHESVQQSENIESEITKNDEDPATLITSEEVEQVNEDENETGMAEYESTDLINYVLKGTIGVSPVTMRLIDMEDALDERGTMWKHTGKLTYKGSGVELKLDGYMKRQYLILEAYDSKGNKAGHIELVGRDFEDGKSGYEGNYDDTNGNSVPVRLIDETVY
jgi:hypothetical protein